MDDLHPLIDFFVKRKKSHPEEFSDISMTMGRWGPQLQRIAWFTTDEEDELLFLGLREREFDAVHQEVLAELLKTNTTKEIKVPAGGTLALGSATITNTSSNEIVFDVPVIFKKGFRYG